jgi:UTP--glucose-1-phosphate uridylyltransferase
MIKIYEKYKCSIVAIEDVPDNQVSNYGIIAGDPIDQSNNIFQVSDMVEKPDHKNSPSNMAIIGRYILTPDIFDILRNMKSTIGKEIQITDALLTQAKKNKVIAYRFKGKRFDCGSVEGYVSATNYFAKKIGII